MTIGVRGKLDSVGACRATFNGRDELGYQNDREQGAKMVHYRGAMARLQSNCEIETSTTLLQQLNRLGIWGGLPTHASGRTSLVNGEKIKQIGRR